MDLLKPTHCLELKLEVASHTRFIVSTGVIPGVLTGQRTFRAGPPVTFIMGQKSFMEVARAKTYSPLTEVNLTEATGIC